MDTKTDCIFCKIAKGEAPSHKIWEDEKYLAFLSIFPNTEGFSVVITKEHNPSYAFDNPDEVLVGLVLATKKVAKLIDKKLRDVGRSSEKNKRVIFPKKYKDSPCILNIKI